MKTMINNSDFNFQGFETLSANEMMQVRGGEGIPPKTREIDIYEEEGQE